MLAALIVPEQVIFVPVYVMMSKLDWLNTFWALIVPHGASAYAIFLLRQAFKSINNDVLEAARVDGAGRFSILYRLLFPMAMPTIVTMGVLIFISSWNSYFWPLIMTNNNDMRVLTVGIAICGIPLPAMKRCFQCHYGVQRHGDYPDRAGLYGHAEAYCGRDGEFNV